MEILGDLTLANEHDQIRLINRLVEFLAVCVKTANTKIARVAGCDVFRTRRFVSDRRSSTYRIIDCVTDTVI